MNYNISNWPKFGEIKALSPSKISYLLSELIYKNIPEIALNKAISRGNEIEEAVKKFYDQINNKNIKFRQALKNSVYEIQTTKNRLKAIKLLFFMTKKFPGAILKDYQKIYSNEEKKIACISDFTFSYKKNNFIVELKTATKLTNKIRDLIWEIQLEIQSLTSNLNVWKLWVYEEKKTNTIKLECKKYEKSDYIDWLINLLIDLNKNEKYNDQEKQEILLEKLKGKGLI